MKYERVNMLDSTVMETEDPLWKITEPAPLDTIRAESYAAGFAAGEQAGLKKAAEIARTKGDEWGKYADQYWKEGERVAAAVRQGWCAGAQNISAAILELITDKPEK